MYKPILYLLFFLVTASCTNKEAGFVIEDLGKTYELPADKLIKGMYCHLSDDEVNYGNTSIRNEEQSSLKWKGSPNSNGFGYFQRNRDLGQVFNLPEGKDVTLDALVLRTSLGSNAIMEGVSGSELVIVFYEVHGVDGEAIRINENGTTKGDLATHGFDAQFNRCDDYIEGVRYVPIHMSHGGIFPNVPATTLPGHPKANNEPYKIQEGHLRYFRCDFQGASELVLKGGKRYAFIVGFMHPGKNQGLALAITTEVHTKEAAEFVRDENGMICWGIRREGDGTLPPTMIQNATPPTDTTAYNRLVRESVFAKNHYETLSPTSNGYPDVDTYRTLEYYLEIKPD